MEDELFYKIVDELREIHFAGRVSFALYSEPLLDKRLPKFVEYASKQLPAAYFNLSTNGDFLDISMWKSLMAAGMDFIFVSQYDGRLNDNIVKLSNILKEDEKMHIEVRIFDVMRDAYCNRGGLVKAGKDIDLPLQKFCIWPFFYMPINYKGKAGICCNDYFGLVEIGDANHQHIADIWHSKILNTYRKKLLLGDRTGLTLCKECNVSPLWEYLPAPAQKIIQPMKKKRTKRFN